jgi:hypothetical protein
MTARGLWIAATLIVLGCIACTDQLEATDRTASPPASNDPDSNAKLPPRQEPARVEAQDVEIQRQRREGRQRRVARQRDDRYAALGLSDEQKQRIAALREKQQLWHTEHGEELEALGEQQRAVKLGGAEVDIAALQARLRELYATLPTEHDIVAVLTDEQRAQLGGNPTSDGMGPPREQAAPGQAADSESAAE